MTLGRVLLTADGLAQFGGCADWERRLRRGQTATTERALRLATRTGMPFGDADFREELACQLGLSADRGMDRGVGSARVRAAGD